MAPVAAANSIAATMIDVWANLDDIQNLIHAQKPRPAKTFESK